MKKILATSIIAASCLMGDTIGFRDFLKNTDTSFQSLGKTQTLYIGFNFASPIVNYCAIQGGNIQKDVNLGLQGTITVNALGEDEVAFIAKASPEERMKKYGNDDKPKYTEDFVKYTFGNRKDGVPMIAGEYRCVKPSDKSVIFTANNHPGAVVREGWIVEHAEEPELDNIEFRTQNFHGDSNMLGVTSYKDSQDAIKKLAKYKNAKEYFDDWQTGWMGKRDKFVNKNHYQFFNTFSYERAYSFSPVLAGTITEVRYFCEAHNGIFKKDGILYTDFLKNFYKNGGDLMVGNKGAFEGKYTCSGNDDGFTMTLAKAKYGEDNRTIDFQISGILLDKK